MNIFQYVLFKRSRRVRRLGMPLHDESERLERENLYASLRDGKGWRVPRKEPLTRADGTTRGMRKRRRQSELSAKVKDEQLSEAMRLVRWGGGDPDDDLRLDHPHILRRFGSLK